jgi:hypothetical protein
VIRKTLPLYYKQNVSIADGVIKNIVIIQAGKDKVGDNFDMKSLEQLVLLGNAQSQGVKSRFGHPNLCDDALGTYLGRYKNYSIGKNDENLDVVIADLHVDDIAKKSPKGDLYTYVVEMAQKNSDMFGNSIVYNPDKPEVKKEQDETGNEIEVPYERFRSFIASDLVDSPAATTSLFKDTDSFASKATAWMDENPEIFELINKNPQILKSFLIKYSNYKKAK